MTHWKFSCERQSDIPLPPAYTFPRAFNYLNAESNSFYILESDNGSYIQCGGSKQRCTVELRIFDDNGTYKHYRIGKMSGSHEWTEIQMSAGIVWVQEREVLNHWEAIELFNSFFAGEGFPVDYAFREVDI